jgi:hypothetical protein
MGTVEAIKKPGEDTSSRFSSALEGLSSSLEGL